MPGRETRGEGGPEGPMTTGDSESRRMLVVGLDSAAPELVFGTFRNDLPTITRLARKGSSGLLESTIPAITVPAWS